MKGNSIGANQILSEQQITTQNKVDDQIGNAQGIKQLTGGEPLNGAGQSLAQRRNSNVADQPVSKSEQQLSASELASVKAKTSYNQLDSSNAYKRIMNDFVPVFLEYCDEQTRLTPEKCIMYFIKMFYSKTQNHYNPLFDASKIIQETFMTKILPNLPENLKDPLLKQNNSELEHLIKKLNLNQELVYCQSIFYHLFIEDPQNPSQKELNRCIEATIQVGRKSANSFSQEHIMERIDHYITDDLGIKEDIKRAFLNKNKL